MTLSNRTASLLLLASVSLFAQRSGAPPRVLPDGAGRDTVQRVCGSSCHGAELVMGKGNSRDGWAATVNSMIARSRGL